MSQSNLCRIYLWLLHLDESCGWNVILDIPKYPKCKGPTGINRSSQKHKPCIALSQQASTPKALGPDNPYFTPADIKTAYNLPSSGGSGTIAIVDAYDAPKIAADLAAFSAQWGLPTANLEVHKMSSFIRAIQDGHWRLP